MRSPDIEIGGKTYKNIGIMLFNPVLFGYTIYIYMIWTLLSIKIQILMI